MKRSQRLILRGVPVADHRREDLDLSLAREGRLEQRVVSGRILDDPRKHARAGEVQARRANAEVAFRRRIDPVGPVPEVHAVEVELQDPSLREAGLEPDRHRGVLQLPPRRVVVAPQVQDLRELLRQGAAAL